MDRLNRVNQEPEQNLTEIQQLDMAAQIAHERRTRLSAMMDAMWSKSIVPQMSDERQEANRKAAAKQTVLPDFEF